jgi:hypothetical protein
VIGTPERFHCGKQIGSYIGLVPDEKSSGDRRSSVRTRENPEIPMMSSSSLNLKLKLMFINLNRGMHVYSFYRKTLKPSRVS